MFQREKYVLSASLALVAAAALPASAGLLGGAPVIERIDSVGGIGKSFSGTLYTAVYHGQGSALPDDPVLFPLQANETVFIYLLHNNGSAGNIEFFAVTNPSAMTIPMVGFGTFEVPDFNEANRIKPSVMFAGASHVEWQFKANAQGLLKPGQWTVLIARSTGGWQEVDSYLGSFTTGFDGVSLFGPGPTADLPQDDKTNDGFAPSDDLDSWDAQGTFEPEEPPVVKKKTERRTNAQLSSRMKAKQESRGFGKSK